MKRAQRIVLFAAIVLLSTQVVYAEGAGMPHAVVASTVYEFESVPDGTEVKHDFVLQNTGDAPLKVDNVRTG
ncbi:MAG: DUF1573 domain-containing protein [Thermodesulfobacteriota bacterium]|nr:DUF1573 domain-containing protein [Thermodesulfobacteriota bacterium]